MEENSKVVDLIRKCLALAGSPNEHEATAAMAKAQELLEKYNLDISNVSVQEKIGPELFKGEVEYAGEWSRTLYSGIAKQNFCVIIGIGSKKSLRILGRLPNVIATHEMVEWLSAQLERLANIELASYDEYSIINGRLIKGTSNKQYRIDFLFGATHRVLARLNELNEARQESVPNVRALTIVLLAEAQHFLDVEYPRRVSHFIEIREHSQGYEKGIDAAGQVGIVPPSRHINKDDRLYLTG